MPRFLAKLRTVIIPFAVVAFPYAILGIVAFLASAHAGEWTRAEMLNANANGDMVSVGAVHVLALNTRWVCPS